MVKDIGYRGEEDMREIEKIIEEIDRLRPVSHINDKILEITSNPYSSLSQLVDVIKYDQGIDTGIFAGH